MNKDKIDILLAKYFEGMSSLKEEEILRSYFSKKQIDESHIDYQPMFNYFSNEKKGSLISTKSHRQTLYIWFGIAASILILVGIWQTGHQVKIESQSIVYIDGKEITDSKKMNLEILNSIENVSEINEDLINTQIGVLDSFTE